ncbi:hypothetical protein RhiirA4_419750 [Rhizophagus irregularis]|uniref:Uncharacterized protein n=1 Tax=Rhizophagus irregularis TaxID=588596 RepID=A0A2I1GFD9_9GLOM|nr:hypothetical protein RhiirA4_419750 [Rhizophagus irregularis]
MEFLLDQVTSEIGYNMLKEDLFVNHSFNKDHFFELRKKKEASFKCKDSNMAEQSTSAVKDAIVDNVIQNLQELEISEQATLALGKKYLEKRMTNYLESNYQNEKMNNYFGIYIILYLIIFT